MLVLIKSLHQVILVIRRGGVAAIYYSRHQIKPKTKAYRSSFKSLNFSLSHHNGKSKKPVQLVVVYWPLVAGDPNSGCPTGFI